MDKNKNYYGLLGVNHNSSDKEIKKSYYKLSFKYHPDQNKDADIDLFNKITEAYDVLSNPDIRCEYDMKSKYGKNYNEYYELFDINIDYNYSDNKQKVDEFKKNEVNNIQILINDEFDGSVEYERWVKCKKCDGTGKDLESKIIIRDNNGNIVKVFDGEDGCDFCDGLGKDILNNLCVFCNGKGKVGLNACSTCDGNKRILGKQKLSGIKIEGEFKKIDSMGHFSKDGKVGYLILAKESKK